MKRSSHCSLSLAIAALLALSSAVAAQDSSTQLARVLRGRAPADIEELKALKSRAGQMTLASKSLLMNQERVQFWELDHLLDISLVIAESALARKESRGGHYREDFPERRQEFHYHTLAFMPTFGGLTLDKMPIDMSIYEAQGEHFEKFGIIERKY